VTQFLSTGNNANIWGWLLPIVRKLGFPILDHAFVEVCADICTDATHPMLQNAILQKFAAGRDLDIQVSSKP